MYIPATDNVVKGYEIANSLRFNDNDSAYLSRTPASAGNRKTWTWAGWVKRGNLGTNQAIFSSGGDTNNFSILYFHSSDKLFFEDKQGGVFKIRNYPTALFRDVGAWYHIVCVMDTTNGTANDRQRLYINGELVTSNHIDTIASSLDGYMNNTNTHDIGRHHWAATYYADKYMATPHLIDGQALTPSSFGEFGDYGEFKPIAYTGTYGTNGFHLDFKDAGALGNDTSGNNNDWTPTNLAATDQMLDTPSNNFAVMNVLNTDNNNTHSQGNLEVNTGSADFGVHLATMGVVSSKYYFEVLKGTSSTVPQVGFAVDETHYASTFGNVIGALGGYGYRQDTGAVYHQNSIVATYATYATGDVIGFALNMVEGEISFYKNGVLQGTLTGVDTSKTYFPAGCDRSNSAVAKLNYNFGQDSSFAGNKTAQGNTDDNGIGDFYYSPPSGYLALCTKNLDEPTVIPSEHFNTVLYTGNGATGQSVTGVGFSPDLTWIKARSAAYLNIVTDTIRGAGETLFSNLTNAENTYADFVSFDSDGFTVDEITNPDWNDSGVTFVSWNWKANGAGVSNTDGSITSTVSANTDAGFSIVSYTGTGANATVGHGLSQAPELIIIKDRDDTSAWRVYSETVGNTKHLELNSTVAETVSSGSWNNTSPNSTVVNLGSSGSTNDSGNNHIAYAFHSVDGFSKFGSYTGNGSTDGPFVYCGFRPAYVMVKRADGVANWDVFDSEINPYNVSNDILWANLSSAEASFGVEGVDFLSNGFKLRVDDLSENANGGSYIFMAFAEHPFKNTNAR